MNQPIQIPASRSSRRGRGSQKRFDLVIGGRPMKGLSAKQVIDSVNWTHCDGEHQGVKVNSIHIGRADDTQIAMAYGDDKQGLTLVPAVDFIVAHQRTLDLANSIFSELRAAGKI